MEPTDLPSTLDAEPFRLRLVRASDEAAVIACVQDPEIPRWTTVPSPYGAEQFQNYRRVVAEAYEARSGLHMLIVDDADRVLGALGTRMNWKLEEAEIGYWLAAEARGRGVVNRTARVLCTWLFERGFQRIEARALRGNAASSRALARLGFRHEGTLRSVAAHGCGRDARVEMEVHGLLPGELV